MKIAFTSVVLVEMRWMAKTAYCKICTWRDILQLKNKQWWTNYVMATLFLNYLKHILGFLFCIFCYLSEDKYVNSNTSVSS